MKLIFKDIDEQKLKKDYYNFLNSSQLHFGRIFAPIVIVVLCYFIFQDFTIRNMPERLYVRVFSISIFLIYFFLSFLSYCKKRSKNLNYLFHAGLSSLLFMMYYISILAINKGEDVFNSAIMGCFTVIINIFLLYRGKVGVLLLIYIVPSLFLVSNILLYHDIGNRFIDFSNVFTAIIGLILVYWYQEKLRRNEFSARKRFEHEKKKTDTLLELTLPDKIIKELRTNGYVKPKIFKSTSVVFIDFVNFTQISKELSPDKLITILDDYFSGFDEIIKKHKLEKLKTIGDEYMYAGGVPAENESHAVDSVLAALEIINLSNQEKDKGNTDSWSFRIGINTGSLIGAVIGNDKFLFDVWGDTVNKANRIVTSGKINAISISKNTYESIKDFFACNYEGKVKVKGLGYIDIYSIKGIKKELSDQPNFLLPNSDFWKLYKQKFNL